MNETHWKTLNSVSVEKSEDHTYIRTLLEILYEGEPEKIPYRSLNGVKEGFVERGGKTYFRAKKEPMSPKKRVLVNNVFRNRVNTLQIPSNEKSDRTSQSNIDLILSAALNNLKQRQRSSEENVEMLLE